MYNEKKIEECTTVPTTNNIYTNTKYKLKSIYTNKLTKLVPQENITLNVANNSGLQLQTSINEIEWKNVDDKEKLEDARYIRVIQLGDIQTTFNLTDFQVESNEIATPSFISSTITSNASDDDRTTGKTGNVFDGDLFSVAKFTGNPKKDGYIIYDLGQTINNNAIKYYVLDTELDHIRDAKFQVSLDKNTWNDVMQIGDGVQNSADNKDTKSQDNGYEHGGSSEVAFAFKEATNLN